jgi:hypothetical protein
MSHCGDDVACQWSLPDVSQYLTVATHAIDAAAAATTMLNDDGWEVREEQGARVAKRSATPTTVHHS